MPELRRSKRNLRCWTRKNKTGKKYRVCTGSSGQKNVRKLVKKHRGSTKKRGGSKSHNRSHANRHNSHSKRHNKSRSHSKSHAKRHNKSRSHSQKRGHK